MNNVNNLNSIFRIKRKRQNIKFCKLKEKIYTIDLE